MVKRLKRRPPHKRKPSLSGFYYGMSAETIGPGLPFLPLLSDCTAEYAVLRLAAVKGGDGIAGSRGAFVPGRSGP